MTNPNFPELEIDCAHCVFGCSAIRAKNVKEGNKKWTKRLIEIFECRIFRPSQTSSFPEININDWCGYFCDAETLARPFVGLNAAPNDPAKLRHKPVQPRKIHAEDQPREEVAE
ncbi:MAG: hypothetical protein ACI4Q3_00415 [Kiritimatiellia bacterium]